MALTFTAFEVFKIAEEVRRGGTRFYREAAELFDNPDIRSMLLELAERDSKQREAFARFCDKLRHEQGEPKDFDPSNYKAVAGLSVFAMRPNPAKELSGKETKEEIVRKAVKKEQDIVTFYHGLEDFVPEKADKDKIEEIIKEDRRHINILSRLLQGR